MSNPGKALFSLFLLLTILTYIVYRSDATVVDVKKEAYTDAIQAASQVATLNIIETSDINKLYDGNTGDTADIPINFGALDDFRSTLYRLLETKKSGTLGDISNINIPLVGFVTYDYIIGVTYGEAYKDVNTLESIGYTYEKYLKLTDAEREEVDKQLRSLRGNYLLPMGYTFYVSDNGGLSSSLSGRTWRFTLGDYVYIPTETGKASYDITSGSIKETKFKAIGTELYTVDERGRVITDTASPNYSHYDISGYLHSIGFNTIKELSNYIVMASINDYLNAYTGVGFNTTAENTGTSLLFNLGESNYSSNMADYNSNSAVIEGPGLFAIIDLYKGSGNNTRLYQRMASFGGSELVPSRSAKSSYGN